MRPRHIHRHLGYSGAQGHVPAHPNDRGSKSTKAALALAVAALEGAGASAVERFVYGGQELATTLADCGLTEETSVEAETRVYAAA